MDTRINGARSYISKFSFLFHLENRHTKAVNSKFELKRSSRLDVQFFDLQLPISYCQNCVSLVIVTIIRHVFINILIKTTYLRYKIWHWLWEKCELSYDTKSLKKKEVEKIGLGSRFFRNSPPDISQSIPHRYRYDRCSIITIEIYLSLTLLTEITVRSSLRHSK